MIHSRIDLVLLERAYRRGYVVAADHAVQAIKSRVPCHVGRMLADWLTEIRRWRRGAQAGNGTKR